VKTNVSQQERGTAIGYFLSGSLIGVAFGPFIGGVIVTFTNWRVIFWMQAALGGIATIGVFFLLPETIHPGQKASKDLEGLSSLARVRKLAQLMNPLRVVRLFQYRNIIAVVRFFPAPSCDTIVAKAYSLSAPPHLCGISFPC